MSHLGIETLIAARSSSSWSFHMNVMCLANSLPSKLTSAYRHCFCNQQHVNLFDFYHHLYYPYACKSIVFIDAISRFIVIAIKIYLALYIIDIAIVLGRSYASVSELLLLVSQPCLFHHHFKTLFHSQISFLVF